MQQHTTLLKISNIINQKGKNRQSLLLFGKKTPSKYSKKVYTISNLSKLVTRENSSTQKSIAKSLNASGKISLNTHWKNFKIHL